jgi:hypothetical protein
VWLALRHAGAAGYREMIAQDIRLSGAMADAVRRCDELELVTQELSITTFRYVPQELRPTLGDPAVERYLDTLNRQVLDRLQRSGEAFVSNAVVGSRYLLRACIVNFHTTRADVEATVDIAVRLGREVNAELGAAIPGAARSSHRQGSEAVNKSIVWLPASAGRSVPERNFRPITPPLKVPATSRTARRPRRRSAVA